MKLKFICTRWGSEHIPWPQLVQQVKEAGYEGIETPLPEEGAAEIVRLLKENDLLFIIQHYHTSLLNTPEEQYKAFEAYLWKAVEYQPLFINSQTGKDYFTLAENERLFQIANRIQQQSGVRILHETHRGKWSFAAHITKHYLSCHFSAFVCTNLASLCTFLAVFAVGSMLTTFVATSFA